MPIKLLLQNLIYKIYLFKNGNTISGEDLCYKEGSKLITTAYYCGSIPISWNAEECKYEKTTVKWKLFYWKLTVISTLLGNFIYLVGAFKLMHEFEYNFNKSVVAFHATVTSIACNSMMLNINILFKVNDVQSFFNNWIQFYKKFQSKFLSKI